MPVSHLLHQKKIPVLVVNPLVIKRFVQMCLVRAKTDKVDAKLIAQYTELEHLPLWQPTPALLSEAAQEMTQTRYRAIVRSIVEQLIKQRTALLNQQDAFNQLPHPSKKRKQLS